MRGGEAALKTLSSGETGRGVKAEATPHSEYLRSFLHGSSDQKLFKKNVPVGTYEDIKPYIERVANGEPSNVISGKPIIGFVLSSGTSSGKQKLIPLTNKFLENASFITYLRSAVLSKHFDGHNQGKGSLHFVFTKPTSITPSGHLSDWITDLSCRDSVSMILGGPNPQMADLIEDICNQKSWKVSILYGSSEATFGLNLDPLCKLDDITYTLMPNMAYFEFLPVDEGNDAIVDLANVKLREYYELVATTYSGLHRCRVGDILQVTGFYNSAPKFKFVRRANVVISVHLEATTEEDLLKAVTCASQLLKSYDMILRDFTCYPHISEVPGHYVLYLELKGNNKGEIIELIDTKVLVECCAVVEESLDALYRNFRSNVGSIGALEIKLVKEGTFDSLMKYFIAQGASTTQYKTPRCIKSSEALQVLENKVLARFFSERSPPIDSSLC
ncbi:hypothetical protein AALP_AA7G202400 [Arabis alpina]|uniref:Uncharacterized protein n=1 Tax=Arabis alpina TaxID=50452 RepID=A0A087GJD0_ARAAL|nr:hypothetical protein AALP_AA7G202400 [Arabis alpina]